MSDLLVGAWELLSFERHTAEGVVDFPFGKTVTGLLVYTRDMRVTVHLSAVNRPRFQSNDVWKGTSEELRSAFSTYNAYFGRYEIDVDARIVRHHVEGCMIPNWVGSVQERIFELNGDQLTLSMPPVQAGGVTGGAVLVWRGVEPRGS